MRCPTCGELNPAGFRFCGSCGAALPEAAPGRETRKVVTVVFCDLSGSTALGDTADPEALRAVMRDYYAEMRAILERHGGTVEKFIGDAVMAVFGVPVAHEDDALRAVRAAWEMRAAVPALGLSARIGVNTGQVMAGEGDTLVTGDAVNVAARLEQAAEPGDVLIGEATARLVRDAVSTERVEVAAKGKPEPLAAFRLADVDPDAAAIVRRMNTPLVGRSAELEQLTSAFERAVRERRCHLFTVLGVAGVGKSRLVREALAGLDATVLEGRCLDYGEGITFWPVISILKQLGTRAEGTLARLVEGAPTPNELFWAVRAQLEEVASERPLVICFEDIQWGEQTFLDMVDHITDLSRGAPILVVCLARPEFLEKRPGWGGGKLNATTILLQPLSAGECGELIAALGGVDPAAREQILAAADGNPLFLEEMLALTHEDGGFRVPGSVQALLQARLDQLGGLERSVLEHGSVEGEVFHRGAVVELTRTADVEPQLVGLVRKELIHPVTATLAGEHAFRFRHLLIRDAAYDALPKETRAQLHARFAAWLEVHGRDLIELDEVLGYHLEQAARYCRELGRADHELERRAGRALAAAGSRAAARGDGPGANNLLGRALGLLPADDERRPQALLDQLVMLELAGHVDQLALVIDELEASTDPRLRMHGRLARGLTQLTSDPVLAMAEVRRTVEEAERVFTAAGDQFGLASAHQVAALAYWLESRALPAVAELEQSIELGRQAGAAGLVDRSLVMLTGSMRYGPFSPHEVRERVVALRESGSLMGRYSAFLVEANLEERVGRFDDALETMGKAVAVAEGLGRPLMQTFTGWQRAEILHSAGRLQEAAAAYRQAIAEMQQLGHTSFRSTALINLAWAVYEQGDADEAERLVAEGQALGAAEDVVNFAHGQRLRALVAIDLDSLAEAEALAREALEYAYRTDFPRLHAEAHETLAHVLLAAGRADEARAEARRALELWERYGYTSEASRPRGLLAEQ